MKIIILGAGISGLATAWFLKNAYGSSLELTILEKKQQPGGWIQTINKQGYLFELGPRSCRASGAGEATLRLAGELGLQDEIIWADTCASNRYLWYREKLRQLPSSPAGLLAQPWLWPAIPGLVQDLVDRRKPPRHEESIAQFTTRRFNQFITDTLIDPLVSGIYAGRPDRLSAAAAFPSLPAWEKERGSVLLGLIAAAKNASPKKHPRALFSFRQGLSTLTKTLANKLQDSLVYNCSVESIQIGTNECEAVCQHASYKSDYLISTLPAHSLAALLPESPLAAPMKHMPFRSVTTVSCGYPHAYALRGFGYLIPSNQKQLALGVTWDSSTFPQQNQHPHETRLTVMLRPEVLHNAKQTALDTLAKHLGITENPECLIENYVKNAIPQYVIGHQKMLKLLAEEEARLNYRLRILGNSFTGVAVNDCVAAAETLASQFSQN